MSDLWVPSTKVIGASTTYSGALVADPTVCHIATNKDEAQAIEELSRGMVFRRDTWRDREAYNEIVVAKARLLKDYPFWGVMGMMLTLVEMNQFPTLAVDGRHLFYNSEFIMKLSRGELLFAVCHEIMHCLYLQCGFGSRGFGYTGVNVKDFIEPKKFASDNEKAEWKRLFDIASEKMKHWNYASDFIVNDEIIKSNMKDVELITTVQILHDEQFRGWASEDVYDYLRDNPDYVEDKCGGGTFDTHIEVEIVKSKEEAEAKAKKDGKKIRIIAKDDVDTKRKWRQTIFSAAAAQQDHDVRTNGAGCIPEGIKRMLDDLIQPRVNWRQALRRFVQTAVKRGYSFARPNKALFNAAGGMTLPSFRTRAPKLTVSIAVDTSGSVSKAQLTAFVSEIQGIMQSFPAYDVEAWCFDGDVTGFTTMSATHSTGSWSDITKFANKVSGGGGTDFMQNWEFMRKRKSKPKLLIVATDGQPCGEWGEPMYCPTMFLIFNNGKRIQAPFGQTVHYDEAA